MSKYAGTIAKSTTLMATVAALVATSTAFAGAAEAAADGPSPLAAPGAHYELVDSQGNVVGELVSESATRVRLRLLGVTTVQRLPQATVPARTDTTFHPNYDHALSAGQMSAAWQAEFDRLFPQPVTGGG
jgi:hypothetical protein